MSNNQFNKNKKIYVHYDTSDEEYIDTPYDVCYGDYINDNEYNNRQIDDQTYLHNKNNRKYNVNTIINIIDDIDDNDVNKIYQHLLSLNNNRYIQIKYIKEFIHLIDDKNLVKIIQMIQAHIDENISINLKDNKPKNLKDNNTKTNDEISRANKLWTDNEEQQLKDLFLHGKKINDIVRILKRNKGGITSRLKKLNLLN